MTAYRNKEVKQKREIGDLGGGGGGLVCQTLLSFMKTNQGKRPTSPWFNTFILCVVFSSYALL
jgi:hypothetical protein